MGRFGKELVASANEAVAMTASYEMSIYYRLTATIYWESAKVLSADLVSKGKPVSGNRLAIPFYHLVSHATELLLKCAVLKRNGSVKILKKLPVRHSLSLLLNELQKLSIPVSDKSVSLINALSEQHERHVLRYDVLSPDNEIPVYTPAPEEIFEMLTELLLAGRIATYGR
jgi:hypothetical protein